jgi:hypothetical protein
MPRSVTCTHGTHGTSKVSPCWCLSFAAIASLSPQPVLRHARRSKQTSTVISRDLLLIFVTNAVVLESILLTSDYGHRASSRFPGLGCDGNVPYRRLMSYHALKPQ